MAKKASITEKEMILLEEQVESLLGALKHLMDENKSLRAQQDNLASERAGLIEKHDVVRNRVEAIVTRLKSLESGA